MRKMLMWLVVFVICVCSSCSPASAAQDPVRQAMERARTEKKHVFVYFSADWCTYCHKMEQETLDSGEYKTFLPKHYVYVKVMNPDEKTVKEYKIRMLPTYVIVSSDGSVVAYGEGYKNVHDFTRWHNGFMGVKRPLRTLFKIFRML